MRLFLKLPTLRDKKLLPTLWDLLNRKKILKIRPSHLIMGSALFLSGCSYRSTSFPDSTVQAERKIFHRPEIIAIDAGHGGKDPGASSQEKRYEEKELTLSTAYLVRDYLTRLGYRTLLTRSQDSYVSLDSRADAANTLHADLFVSIHYNYSSNKEAQGIEIYYKKIGSKKLGDDVLKKIIHHTKASSRGVKKGDFAVIRETKMPAILIEGGFLSNPEERKKLKDPKYLEEIAQGIAEGIDAHLCSQRDSS
ncbi:MAG: N-acetylmuramoyl-L-alanine amidase [Chlamydiales bacterium]